MTQQQDAPTTDAGVALHSPSTELMTLVNIHNDTWTDFTTITNYIQKHLYEIVHEIHDTYDKLLIDNGQVQINCPPIPEPVDSDASSSTLLLRTLSEKEADGVGIIVRREIKVYDCGPDGDDHRSILIREDTVQVPLDTTTDPHPNFNEQSVTIRVPKKTA